MANWSQDHDLVYAFVCVSFLADGQVDEWLVELGPEIRQEQTHAVLKLT